MSAQLDIEWDPNWKEKEKSIYPPEIIMMFVVYMLFEIVTILKYNNTEKLTICCFILQI